MPGNNLNRDQLWTSEVWRETDAAVLAQVNAIRVAQKVFPTTAIPGVNVPADVFDPETMSIAEGRTKSLIELSVEFRLTQAQVDNEHTDHTTRTLAKLAAKYLAGAEDSLIFQGAGAALPKTVKVENRESAENGLLGVAQTIQASAHKADGFFGDQIFKKVTEGIAQLTKLGQAGPYALFLESELFAETYAPADGTLLTTADRLIPLVPDGFYATSALPKLTALLVSTGGEPISVYVGADVKTQYTQEDLEGRHRFRVFERLQFVARDPQAMVKLVFPEANT
jgi:uncharacterized linocin/CFP29 family protein